MFFGCCRCFRFFVVIVLLYVSCVVYVFFRLCVFFVFLEEIHVLFVCLFVCLFEIQLFRDNTSFL